MIRCLALLQRFKSEQWVSGMPSSDFERYLYYVINNTYILPIYSDPTEEDSDADGLLDNLDANPFKIFDDRFIIVDDINYFPKIDFIDYNKLGTGYTEFNPQYGTVGYDGRDYCYNTKEPSFSNYKDYYLLQLAAKGARTPLISNIAGKLSVDQWATMYHSSDFLQHFLGKC